MDASVFGLYRSRWRIPSCLDLDDDGALAVALKLAGDADNFGLFCDASAARSKASIDGPA